MYHLGQMHEFGLGFDKDLARAYRLYSISASRGYALSQLRAGNCLFAGAGTEQKVQEAFIWYKKASAQVKYLFAIIFKFREYQMQIMQSH